MARLLTQKFLRIALETIISTFKNLSTSPVWRREFFIIPMATVEMGTLITPT